MHPTLAMNAKSQEVGKSIEHDLGYDLNLEREECHLLSRSLWKHFTPRVKASLKVDYINILNLLAMKS